MSGGRIGWNIVTGEAEAAAQNYGRKEHWDNNQCYEWAGEFVQVVKSLWDRGKDDARAADKEKGPLHRRGTCPSRQPPWEILQRRRTAQRAAPDSRTDPDCQYRPVRSLH
ncbi:LLM class flavin-dependent oxidoreductase [Tianweitania populi]|uniref:LLM class flavin-dependent oxidoreductase n=1 Tax=Tianweitania populi TaxID=1607949 RepID=A0A8J3DYR9_9HYPH|nr:hypothetical protein GCM10016234_18690 [Tianweitania populi]